MEHGEKSGSHVLETPLWVLIVRGAQFLLSLIILGLAGRLIHDLYLDEFGLSVATAIITWAVLFYTIFTEKIPSWQAAYHVLAVTVLEAFLVIMWLATFAAVAARRAMFTFSVNVSGCVDDGSAVNSKTCFTKRDLERRAILFKSGGDMMSAIAGLGALVWLMYIATFVWTLIMFLRGRKEGRFPIGGTSSTSNTYQMEPKAEQAAPMMTQQPIQPQQTGEYQQSPLSPYQQQQQQPPYQGPQDNSQYNQYAQQYPYQGSELSGTPHPQQYTTPPPQTTSPPPHPQQPMPYYEQPQQQYNATPAQTTSPPPQQPYYQQPQQTQQPQQHQ